jgi:serine/threonine protein kinase
MTAGNESWVRPVRQSGRLPSTGGPQHVGPYRILRELGRGSNGVVLLGERDGRPYAIKVLLGQDLEGRARFAVEARVAAKLNDPGIVPALDVGTHDGHPYCVMAYCPGPTLQQRLRRGPLLPSEAALLLRELTRTVSVAHRVNVLHRDLKPANIILEEGSGRPRITDFGLARDRSQASGLTLSHEVLGTPLYMAPETFEGSKFVDGRVDVYALGVILYECLTGRLPYVANTSLEVANLVRRGGAPPPRACDPTIPRRLDTACMTALATRPEDRYARAADLMADLDAYLLSTAPSDDAPLETLAPAHDALPAPSPAVPRAQATTAVLTALALACLALMGSVLWGRAHRAPMAVAGRDTEGAGDPLPSEADADSESDSDSDSASEADSESDSGSDSESDSGSDSESDAVSVSVSVSDLRAAMREIAPFDPRLVEEAERLLGEQPERSGELLLLTSDYLRRRAMHGEALRWAYRLEVLGDEALAGEALRIQVLCLWRMGRPPQAWRPPLDALASQRDSAAGAYGRAVRAYVGGQAQAALRATEEALGLDPDYLPAKILKTWVMGQSGGVDIAESFEDSFAARAQDDPYLLMERLRRRFDQGLRWRGLEAAEQLRLLIEDRDPQLHRSLSDLTRMVQRVRAQLREASRRLQQDPGDPEARMARAAASLLLGDLDRSRDDFQQAQRIDPEQFAVALAQSSLTPAERDWVKAQLTH